jgi:hypothetical protein
MHMKKLLLLHLLLAVLALGRTADPVLVPSGREFQHARHDTNNIRMVISNFGTFGQNETGNTGGLWWRYSGYGISDCYIYGAGIWFGTVDSLTGDTLVTIGYGPSGGQFEFAPGLSGWPPSHPAAIIYMYPDNWPPPLDTLPMAPQDPISDQDSWCCFNDCDSVYHMPGDTRPIGLEVYQTVYAWDRSEVVDIIFLVYDVKNVSGSDLHDCYIGLCTDCSIGYENADELSTGILYREYVIDDDTLIVDDVGYQWQEWDEFPWPIFPGLIGFDLLQTPFDLEWGQDKDNDGIPDQFERDSAYYWNNLPQYMWDVDDDSLPDWRDPSENPQYGLTSFKRFALDLEPSIDYERYLTMAGYNILTGQYEPFDTILPDPWNQRFLMSSGPFDLGQDSVVTLVFAIMVTAWSDDFPGAPPGYPTFGTPDSALALVDNCAQHFYDMYWYLYTGVEEHFEFRISDCGLEIIPNPIMRDGNIQFSLHQAGNVTLKLYNTLGQLVETVHEGIMTAGVHEIVFNTQELSQGTYFVVLETSANRERQSFAVVR